MRQGSVDLRTRVILFGIKLAPGYARMVIPTRMSQILCISILSFCINLKLQYNETNHSLTKYNGLRKVQSGVACDEWSESFQPSVQGCFQSFSAFMREASLSDLQCPLSSVGAKVSSIILSCTRFTLMGLALLAN